MLSVDAQDMLITSLRAIIVASFIIAMVVTLKLRKAYKNWVRVYLISWVVSLLLLFGALGVYARTQADYLARDIASGEVPYYTYGKYDGDFEKALADFNADKDEARAYTLYDLKPGEKEWNELRGGETKFYKFTIFVQHRLTESDYKNKLGTPSFVDVTK